MKTFGYSTLLLALAGSAQFAEATVAMAQPGRVHRAAVSAAQAEDPADSLFRLGRQAITDNDYRRAASLFARLVSNYPKASNAGDALYWRAWALYHLGVDRRSKADLDDALEAIDRQQKEYASATSASDGRELMTRIRSAQASLGDAGAVGDITGQARQLQLQGSCTGSRADEETRMAALEGLLNMNSDDAVPILKEVLKQRDACRVELRKKAVWLIAQKRSPDVVSTLLDVARSDPSIDVRGDAIFWLSQTRSEQAIPALDSVLFSAGNDEIRNKAIFSLSQFRDERARQALRRAAEDEKLPEELRGQAIFWLGNTHGNADLDYFKTLFKKTSNEDLRSKIVQAVSQTSSPEGTAWLLDIARDKSFDVETRKNALFWASQRRLLDLDQVMQIYAGAKGDDAMQEQVIFVLSQRRESAAVDKLMDIAKNDQNIEMRKKAMFWLGQKNDPRVKQFLLDIIMN
jgi:HEAT repeat protein